MIELSVFFLTKNDEVKKKGKIVVYLTKSHYYFSHTTIYTMHERLKN